MVTALGSHRQNLTVGEPPEATVPMRVSSNAMAQAAVIVSRGITLQSKGTMLLPVDD
jgi:hypothetical protein